MKLLIKMLSYLTKPKGMVKIYDKYWVECYPTLHTYDDFQKYRYHWRKVVQNSYGMWKMTDEYLSTNKDYNHS